MNIIQLHEKVRFWIDVVASPRFDSYDIDNALNTMISQYTDEIYSGDNPKEDSFQKIQRIRDILGPLVKKAERGSGSGLYLSMEDVAYRHLLAMKVTFGTSEYRCDPLSYDLLNTIDENPYRRPRKAPNKRAYFIEEDGMIRVIPPSEFTNITSCEVYFLADPATVNYGIEVITAGSTLTSGVPLIAITTPTVYRKLSVNYSLVIGDEYTPDQAGITLQSGGFVRGFTNCDLRNSSHEEIAIRAAALLLRRPVDVLRNKAS